MKYSCTITTQSQPEPHIVIVDCETSDFDAIFELLEQAHEDITKVIAVTFEWPELIAKLKEEPK
jgi:hypothetical protein